MSRLVYLIVRGSERWRREGTRGRDGWRDGESYQNVCGLIAKLWHSPVLHCHGGAVVELCSETLLNVSCIGPHTYFFGSRVPFDPCLPSIFINSQILC